MLQLHDLTRTVAMLEVLPQSHHGGELLLPDAQEGEVGDALHESGPARAIS